jgi:hypothetical protein
MHVASIWPYTMHPTSLRSFLADGISSLIPQAHRLIELRRVFAGLLPDNLRRTSSIANYKQGKVVIFAENSAVAAKLRLHAPTLQGDLMRSGHEVTAIEVQVQPGYHPAPYPKKQARLSLEASRQLSALSDQLPDSKLKFSILSLAKRSDSQR